MIAILWAMLSRRIRVCACISRRPFYLLLSADGFFSASERERLLNTDWKAWVDFILTIYRSLILRFANSFRISTLCAGARACPAQAWLYLG